MLYYLVTVLYILVCVTMMLVVYLQQGKGGDIASAFGGGSSQAAFGARSGATVLSRATAVCAVLFMIVALVLGILGQRGPASVLRGVSLPAPAPAPASPVTPGAQPSTPAAPEPVRSTAPAPGGQAPATPAQTSPSPAAPAPVKP